MIWKFCNGTHTHTHTHTHTRFNLIGRQKTVWRYISVTPKHALITRAALV
jgi:hypothetical protein